MTVTLQHIADKCKVSRVTVSHVLRNPDNTRYAEATRKNILETAEKLQYVPNRVAQHLKKGSTNLLSLVIPFNDPGVLDTVEQVSQQREFGTMVQFTPTPDHAAESRALQTAFERRVDGIIWQPVSPYHVDSGILHMTKQSGIPVVLLQYPVAELEQFDLVRFDWQDALHQGLAHLKQCGYSKIVNLVSDNAYEPQARRADMLADFARREGVEYEELRGKLSNLTGIITDYLKQHSESIGFFGQNWSALYTLDAAEQAGRSIPDDIGIVMLGDMVFGGGLRVSEFTRPRLTSVSMAGDELARTAVNTLIDRIEAVNGAEPRQEKIIPVELKHKESTAVLQN